MDDRNTEHTPKAGDVDDGHLDDLGNLDTEQTPSSGTRRKVAQESPSSADATSRYRIGSVIGRGGMAVVYDASDTLLNRSVAIKVLKPELAAEPDIRARFFNEAAILSQMDHPGVIPVIETGDLPGYGAFYAMKKVRGRTFREILRELNPEDFRRHEETARLLGVFDKVCQTVAYAHARGIVHRDLKPENVMVDDYGIVLVLDWGLAKRMSADAVGLDQTTTQVGEMKGTPAYMSPEQAGGNPDDVDLRSDVFSLGIMLYEILTGTFPFRGKTRTEVLRQIQEREPAHPRKTNRHVDRVLAAIAFKALRKDPEERYPSARELADDTRLYRNYMPTSAYRPRLREHLMNWMGRHPALSTAVCTAVFVTSLFGAAGYHRWAAVRIRLEEQRKAQGIAQQRQEVRRQVMLDRMMAFVDALNQGARVFDDQILELEKQRDALSPDDGAQRALVDRELDEIRTVRNWYVENARLTGANAISLLGGESGKDLAHENPSAMVAIRGHMIEEARGLYRIGQLYDAHNHVWRYLVQGTRIGWNQAQTADLLALKDEIEAKLREVYGTGFTPPDWAQYDPESLCPGGRAFLLGLDDLAELAQAELDAATAESAAANGPVQSTAGDPEGREPIDPE
ncbi:MAG: serine/threonine protein kinase [bacterium]|nr:serine/threonine protein kinase [bacterium]